MKGYGKPIALFCAGLLAFTSHAQEHERKVVLHGSIQSDVLKRLVQAAMTIGR